MIVKECSSCATVADVSLYKSQLNVIEIRFISYVIEQAMHIFTVR